MYNEAVHGHRHLKQRHVAGPSKKFDYVMDVVALLSPLGLIPQVWQILATHTVAGLSLTSWAIFFVLNLLWVFYGISRRCAPIVIANALSGILNFIGVVCIILFA